MEVNDSQRHFELFVLVVILIADWALVLRIWSDEHSGLTRRDVPVGVRKRIDGCCSMA